MTSVDPSTPARPLRTAGMALLALAALALVVGIVSLVGGGPSHPAAASSAPPASGPGNPAVPGSPTGPSAPATTRPTTTAPTTTVPGPPSTQSPPASTTSPGVPTQQVPLRVYNNSMINGLAARAADDLRNAGWNVVEVGSYSAGVLATTTVYFRPGTDEEGAAKELAAQFQTRLEPRFDGIADASAGMILIVTKDYKGLHTK